MNSHSSVAVKGNFSWVNFQLKNLTFVIFLVKHVFLNGNLKFNIYVFLQNIDFYMNPIKDITCPKFLCLCMWSMPVSPFAFCGVHLNIWVYMWRPRLVLCVLFYFPLYCIERSLIDPMFSLARLVDKPNPGILLCLSQSLRLLHSYYHLIIYKIIFMWMPAPFHY